MNIYVKRLFEEWKQHGKIIISCDWDDTLSIWNSSFNNKDDIKRCICLLKLAYATGAYIVIFTACGVERYEEIQNDCAEMQIPISAINSNPIPLPYGNHKKIYYNHNLCDRSGLVGAMDILEEAMYQYRAWQHEQNPPSDVA
jgi:hypothetical protein